MIKKIINIILMLVVFIAKGQAISTQIDSILRPYDSPNKPGLSIGIIKEGELFYTKSLGDANLSYNIKNTDSTVFNLASIAKQFTASAIWALIKEGKLDVEDDIRTYFPDFPNYGSVIKIKHLLNHTSGIRNYHTLMYLSGFDYDKEFYDNKTVYELAKRQKNLNNKPGEKVTYSNTNYNLLALLIEKISGHNLHEYLKTRILNPLGMKNTFIRVSHGNPIKNFAVGYQKKDNSYIFNVTNQLSYGAGSMSSNVRDLSIWIDLLNGNIDKFKELAEFLTTQETLLNGKKANYARGVIIDDYKGCKTVHHSGYGFGGQSQIITLPEKKLGVVILTNLQSINPTPISYKILDLFVKPKKEKPKNTVNKIEYKAQDLRPFTGDYKEINSDMKMVIAFENDSLRAMGSMGDNPIPLVSYDKNKFMRKDAQNVKYNFINTSNHDLIISFGGVPFYFKRAQFIAPENVNLLEFCGEFHSYELGATYSFHKKENNLYLSYKNHENIPLTTVQKDEFGNNDRTLYHFTRNNKNEISGMLLSCDGSVKEIEFVKL